jgi:hypothetical protein
MSDKIDEKRRSRELSKEDHNHKNDKENNNT